MILELEHKKLEAYKQAKLFVAKCYQLAESFPIHEKYNLSSQIRRAALSILLNIAEGASRRTNPEKRRFFEISRSSIVEIDAALDVALSLNYITSEDILELQPLCIRCFSTITGLIKRYQ